MLGPSIIVAPIVNRTGRRTIYLPAGRWYDYWTNMVHHGPSTLAVQATLDTLPLLVREGAIIPAMEAADRIPADRIDPLILDVYPAAESEYLLREDEGETQFHWEATATGYSLEWSGRPMRACIVRVHADPDGRPVVGASLKGGGIAAISCIGESAVQIRVGPTPHGVLLLT
jgi:alpha-glucosidase (family GH31 glycosyl hydrolase)